MTVQAIGFQIVGLTALALWGGGEGVIPMEPVKLAQESFPTEEQIREAINDNGFGVECMEGAVVRVDTLYEHGAKTYGDAQYINLGKGYRWTSGIWTTIRWQRATWPDTFYIYYRLRFTSQIFSNF